MRYIYWFFVMILSFCLSGITNLSAEDPSENPCFVLHWDTVIGGSSIVSTGNLGECEYEVDTEGGAQPSAVQMNIPEAYSNSPTHQIHFTFSARKLDEGKRGDFRILALNTNGSSQPLFALDLFWVPQHRSGTNLFIDGSLNPQIQDPNALVGLFPFNPFEVTGGFHQYVEVLVNFTESSGPGVNDGNIELWIDGVLHHVWSNLLLEWPGNLEPESVSYGVIEVFDPRTRGKITIRPHSPSVTNPEF